MDCRRIESLLPPYVDGEARPSEVAEVERHLTGCPSCRAWVAAERRARPDLQAGRRQIARPLPPGFRSRLAAAMQSQRRPTLGWPGRLSACAAAAAMLVVVVVSALELLSPHSNVLYAAQLAI